MLEQMLRTIEKHNMLAPGDHVAVGLSGGADSVALLHALLACGGAYGLTVSAVHVNHGVRGPEAARDEAFAAELCKARGVRLIVRREDVPAMAAARKMTVEEAGRTARYSAFHDALIELGANKIAVAHQKNDNAETILMRACRGAGLKGLSGIPPVRGAVIRPLIETSRNDIERYCREHAVAFIQDGTNFSEEYTRNHVRLHLIPLIEQRLNPSVTDALCRSAALCQEDDAYLDELAAMALAACENGCPAYAGGLCLRTDTLNGLPAPIQRRVLRLALVKLCGHLRDMSFVHIRDIMKISGKRTGLSVNLPHGILAEMNYGLLFLWKMNELCEGFSYDLHMNTTVTVAEAGVTVAASRKKPAQNIKNGCTAAFCCDKIEQALQVRSARPGDSIYFRQIGGHKKLKDYFAERGLPRRARNGVALLASGRDILWIMDEKPVFSGSHTGSNRCGNIMYVTVEQLAPATEKQ